WPVPTGHTFLIPPAPPEISTLSLHDALPIYGRGAPVPRRDPADAPARRRRHRQHHDRRRQGARRALAAHLGDARRRDQPDQVARSEEHTSELQSRENLVCRLLLEKKKQQAEK